MATNPAPATKAAAKKAAEVVCIYALCCPTTGAVRYIGKANDPDARLRTHLVAAADRTTPVYCWIRKLRLKNQMPAMVILERVAVDWQSAERRIIAEYRARGPLLNVADGGDEPFCPREVRAENGRKNSLKRVGTERGARVYYLKRKMGLLLKSGAVSEAVKMKLRYAANKRPDLFGQWAAL